MNSNPIDLCSNAKKWISKSLALRDSSVLGYNVMIPTILKLEELTTSNVYRYGILLNGEIRLGHGDNRITTQVLNSTTEKLEAKIRNFTPNGKIEIPSHGGLCDYQPVIAAGMLVFQFYQGRGSILSINNNSGHYMPDEKALFIAVMILKEKYLYLFNNTKLNSIREKSLGKFELVNIGLIRRGNMVLHRH
jgi:hypothetical protein